MQVRKSYHIFTISCSIQFLKYGFLLGVGVLFQHFIERSAKQALGVLLGAYWEALEGCGGSLEGSRTALGRLLGGSWQALGGFQEASWTKDRKS